MKTSFAPRNDALTVVEVIVVLGTVMILVLLILPALVPRQPRAGMTCVSNLKQIGLGWLTWGHDHETSEFPFRVPVTNGGTMGSTDSRRNTASWQFAVISNDLSTPKILVCPEDKNVGETRRLADNWSSTDSRGGYLTVGFRDRATSYTIGLEAVSTSDRGDQRIVGTDRNITFDGRDSSCSSGTGETEFIRVKGKNGQNPPASACWTNAIHGPRGNLLSVDGSVQQTSTRDLDALLDLSDDNGSIHFLVPK